MPKSASSSSASSAAASSPPASDHLVNLVWVGAVLYGIGVFLSNAYKIRLQAIEEFGPVIHEFDPYFNWRATQVRCVFVGRAQCFVERCCIMCSTELMVWPIANGCDIMVHLS